jgi:ADP-ribosylglycohydrolase
MFWWGGYGTSTEHTAFLNLKNGIDAPLSGSIAVNGTSVAEQIGGQIFIDTWGLIFPGDMEKAADYAEMAASVSHDQNGLYGARYVAAAIAKAFDTNDIHEVVRESLSVIPADSEYRRVCDAVIDFYEKDEKKDFRACREYLTAEWGYDRYPGICHIIPNSGVIVLSLLYGEGDLARTIEIATMCGWDTDCNAGNAGTILGVLNGFDGLVKKYFTQINDFIAASSSVGSLNIIDVPTCAKEIANYGYELAGEEAPENIRKILDNKRDLIFDFDIPGSTHAFRTSDPVLFPVKHVAGKGLDGTGCLAVLLDRVYRGHKANIYYKPFYRREDFDDERYQPAFSPQVFSGQVMKTRIYLDKWNGDDFGVAPYVRLSHSKEIISGQMQMIQSDEWIDIEFTIPDSKSEPIDEIGLNLESFTRERNKVLGQLYIDSFTVTGKGKHSIDFTKEKTEFKTTTQFTENGGAFAVEFGGVHVITNEDALAITGNFYTKDVDYTVTLKPEFGSNHFAVVRAQGMKVSYLAGFMNQQIAIVKNEFGYKTLKTVDFDVELGKEYLVNVKAVGNKITVSIDGQTMLEYTDENPIPYGCVGYSVLDGGRMLIKDISFEEL